MSSNPFSGNPFSGNPILDAWLAAWTNGLALTTQMTNAWLGQPQQSANPWAAMMGAGAANPWAALSGGQAHNPVAALAGIQSLMSLAMATWGGAAPQLAAMPWLPKVGPWNAGPWNAGPWNAHAGLFGQWASGRGGWAAPGQWPMTVGFSAFPGMTAPTATPALPWPWNQFSSPQPPVESDPMGLGQAMKFWTSLAPAMMPMAGAADPERNRKPDPAPVDSSSDLSKLFPWMAWMK